MPSIIGNGSSAFYGEIDSVGRNEDNGKKSIKVEKSDGIQSIENSTPQRRRLRSETRQGISISSPSKPCSPTKWKSPRRCISSSPSSDGNKSCKKSQNRIERSSKSPRKRLSDIFPHISKWNPKDPEQMSTVKEILHVSTAPSPSNIVCREEEQKKVLEFCKVCVEQKKAGSLYLCGCPGTGKTLSMEKVRQLLTEWVKEEGFQPPDVLAVNCTSLANTTDIFSKIFEKCCPRKKSNGSSMPLQHLQNLFSQKQSSREKMMLVIVDELDYLITKDRSVLHDLFMLTTYPFSGCILIGIANSIDLADRFLPKLQSLNCKPMVITFRAYSKDQILKILQQRLMALPYGVFQSQALELCARKVAAASGDMRKALCVCRSAIEMLEAELRDPSSKLNLLQPETASQCQLICPSAELLTKQDINVVRVDHMAIALSKTFKSATVDTIQSLPQHQQIILCSVVKLFLGGKKETTIGELNRSYTDICKSALIPPIGILEFSNMCRVLSDQGLLKLGQSREDRLKRVTLKVDEADITFALQVEFDSFGIVFGNAGHEYRKNRFSCLSPVSMATKVIEMCFSQAPLPSELKNHLRQDKCSKCLQCKPKV